jgi:ubiquinone/menaquinone biosynthesis C-methylase UbiE
MVRKKEKSDVWQKVKYRNSTDPVVEAYVTPKLDMIEKSFPLKDLTVLDVGCGPGIFTKQIQKRAASVVGIDNSDSMLSRIEGIEFVTGDALNLPFEDNHFDVCFEANVLHHVKSPQKALNEMARVCSKAVIIIEPNRLNPLMFGFSLVFKHERGGLKSSRRYLLNLMEDAHLQLLSFWTTGMISQNNTPSFLVPILRFFDFNFPFGEYHLAISLKNDP